MRTIGPRRRGLSWLFGVLGVPATFTGFLVPIREAGVLLPQLAAAYSLKLPDVRELWN